jgi:hypothetical protein
VASLLALLALVTLAVKTFWNETGARLSTGAASDAESERDTDFARAKILDEHRTEKMTKQHEVTAVNNVSFAVNE